MSLPPVSTVTSLKPRSPSSRATAARSALRPSPGTRTTSAPRASYVLRRWTSSVTVRISSGSPVRIFAESGRSSPWSITTRFGCRVHGTMRTVSSGSSWRTVPMPVSIAQERARSRCTSRRASSPVIQRLCPLASAMRPSSDAAALMRIHGRPVRMRVRKPRCASSASAAINPMSTRMPDSRSRAAPCPFTRGLGSSSAATTRPTRAATNASAQGGVRP